MNISDLLVGEVSAPSGGWTDEALARVAKGIVGEAAAAEQDRRTYFDHGHREDDFTAQDHLLDLYDLFMSAVQQGQCSRGPGVNEVPGQAYRAWTQKEMFENFLTDAIRTLKWRLHEELPRKLSVSEIDQRTFLAAKDLCERSIEALTKYLELPETKRLIGI